MYTRGIGDPSRTYVIALPYHEIRPPLSSPSTVPSSTMTRMSLSERESAGYRDFLRNARSRGCRPSNELGRSRYILVQADAVGVAAGRDVTAEPLHERVPGAPLALN